MTTDSFNKELSRLFVLLKFCVNCTFFSSGFDTTLLLVLELPFCFENYWIIVSTCLVRNLIRIWSKIGVYFKRNYFLFPIFSYLLAFSSSSLLFFESISFLFLKVCSSSFFCYAAYFNLMNAICSIFSLSLSSNFFHNLTLDTKTANFLKIIFRNLYFL